MPDIIEGQKQDDATRPMWEYMVTPLRDISDTALNQFGADGWELCGVAGATAQGMAMIFKRRTSIVHAPPLKATAIITGMLNS